MDMLLNFVLTYIPLVLFSLVLKSPTINTCGMFLNSNSDCRVIVIVPIALYYYNFVVIVVHFTE